MLNENSKKDVFSVFISEITYPKIIFFIFLYIFQILVYYGQLGSVQTPDKVNKIRKITTP